MENISKQKIIYAAKVGLNSCFLAIPKTRGEGFLKSPAGNSPTRYSNFITDLGFDSFCEMNYILNVDMYNNENFERDVVKPLSEWLKFSYKIVSGFNELNNIIEDKNKISPYFIT